MTGIIAALEEEVEALLSEMDLRHQLKLTAKHTCHRGKLWGESVVLMISGVGKVAAAMTASAMINLYDVNRIIFTGVAGSADSGVKVGDVVVGTKLYQHDMDPRPLMPRYGTVFHPEIVEDLSRAARAYLGDERVIEGAIASGDKFFSCKKELGELKLRLPDISCVEMEGAAVAQVCHEYGVPFGIMRTISDGADDDAPTDFPKFLKEVASRYSLEIFRRHWCVEPSRVRATSSEETSDTTA